MSEYDPQASRDWSNDEAITEGAPPGDGYAPEGERQAIVADESEQAGSMSNGRPMPVGEDEASRFLADLARAMRETAAGAHARMGEETDGRRAGHIDAIYARATSDADQLREHTEQDVHGIDGWAESEFQRIQAEREARIAARREELQRRLEQHDALVAREVESVEAAIAAYRSDVDAFFGRIDAQSDPAAIAHLARSRPHFPALDDILATARAQAEPLSAQAEPLSAQADTPSAPPEFPEAEEVASAAAETWAEAPEPTADEGQLIGVMDPASAAQAEQDAWPAPVGTSGESEWNAWGTAVAPAAPSDASGETPPVEIGSTHRSSGALLEAIPALRPMGSWLRRETRDEDRTGHEH